MAGLYVTQHKMRDGHAYWMLALLGPYDDRGTFSYVDKRPGETRQLPTIQDRIIHGEPCRDARALVVSVSSRGLHLIN